MFLINIVIILGIVPLEDICVSFYMLMAITDSYGDAWSLPNIQTTGYFIKVRCADHESGRH